MWIELRFISWILKIPDSLVRQERSWNYQEPYMSLLQSYNLLLDSKNVFLGLKMWSSGGEGSPPLIPKCPLLYIFTIKHLEKLTFDRMMLCLTLLRLTEAWHFCHIVLSSVILLLRISDRDRSCVRHGSARLTFDIVESRMHRDFAGNLTSVKEYRETRLFVLDGAHRQWQQIGKMFNL